MFMICGSFWICTSCLNSKLNHGQREHLVAVTQDLVITWLDYCKAFYMGLPLKVTWKLYLVQNAVPMYYGSQKWTVSTHCTNAVGPALASYIEASFGPFVFEHF